MLRIHGFTPDLLISHPERKVGEDGLAGHGIEVAAFRHAAAGIAETLLDFDSRHTPVDRHPHLRPHPHHIGRQGRVNGSLDLDPALREGGKDGKDGKDGKGENQTSEQ